MMIGAAAVAAGMALGVRAEAWAGKPLPPMMGWSSWNSYRVNISEDLIRRQADALVQGGFAAAGYSYVNIDDGWFGGRDKSGRNTVHAKRFPNGLKPVADYIHAKGLKAGIYSDAGENTCGWYYDGEKQAVKVGFYNHEEEDARLYFDEWGFDFVKVDFGGCTENGNEAHVLMDPKERYTAVANAIAKTRRGKDVLMNVCCWRFPGAWVSDVAVSWRISGDVAEKWESVKGIIDICSDLARFQKPGHYNDMDMLQVGRGMSHEEDKTHFGMWCMLASPLMIGCDLTTVKPETAALLKNPELIAIDQDPLCKQGEVIWRDSKRDVRIYAKPLAPAGSQTYAVALYNATDAEQEFWVQPDMLGLYGELARRDVFERKDLAPVKGPFSWKVPAHGTRIFILSPAKGARSDDLAALAREDYAHAIRPGGVDGSPFWNVYARMFTYPPAFDFSKGGPGTVKYRFTVFDAAGKTHVFDAPSSQSPLTPVWNDVAPGQAWVYVSAVDKDGGEHGIPDWQRDRFSRTFWRSAPFRPGAYPPAPRSYAEAVAKCGDEIFERPATQYFLRNGKPDPHYTHNCYPAKMHSALIHGMLGYAARRPDRAADALKLARIAADYLISVSQPKGAPLEYWPPTYADRREAGSFRYGQNMLIYPCAVGAAYLALYDRVKDAKYLDAAKRIADTYIRLQEQDGTWPIFVRESDGKVLSENRVQPAGVVSFLEKLYRACGEAKYRACGDRAFAWIEAHPLTDWFWEGQFEDAPLIAKYENPSKHPACELALYLLERYPGEKKWLAVARDILRYAEDQFVCWERPCAANGHGVSTPIGGPSAQQNRYDDWFYPCALEQYVYYVPVDASSAKLIKTYLALYRAEGNPLDLAKARALGDALVRIQRPSGYIPTEYALVEKRDNPMQGWLNCTCFTLSALSELAAAQ